MAASPNAPDLRPPWRIQFDEARYPYDARNVLGFDKDGGISGSGSGGGSTGAGAWTAYTPTIAAASGTFTTVAAAGRYWRNGKLIHFQARITITTNGTAAGHITATLPAAGLASTSQALNGFHETNVEPLGVAILAAAVTVARIIGGGGEYPGANGAVLLFGGTYEAA